MGSEVCGGMKIQMKQSAKIKIRRNRKGPDGIDLHFSLAIGKGILILVNSAASRPHFYKNRATANTYGTYAERMR